MCAEGLSSLIKKFEEKRWIRGCKIARGAPVISHMLFADDSYLYCRANEMEARNIKKLLSVFEGASGQKVNASKSSIFFSTNTAVSERGRVEEILGMQTATEHSRYLGLPSTMGRNKTAVLGFLKEKMRSKVESWSGRWMVKAGYGTNYVQVLVASVGSSKEGIHWLSWDKLVIHKDKGGMGFRSLRDFNLAILGKQGWRLMANDSSLVNRVFKAKYYPNGSFLTASLGHNPSFVWRSILEAQSLVKEGCRWSIVDGASVQVLNQPWLPCVDNPYITSTHPGLVGAKVNQLMCTGERVWDGEILDDLLNDRDKQLIQNVMLSDEVGPDQHYWNMEASGNYTVKSAYNFLQRLHGRWNESNNFGFWRSLWNLKIPANIKHLLWRACMGILPTSTQLRQKHVDSMDS
ncbi:hypothetical protein AgCh_001058 [Apium graveolens]